MEIRDGDGGAWSMQSRIRKGGKRLERENQHAGGDTRLLLTGMRCYSKRTEEDAVGREKRGTLFTQTYR